MLKKDNMFHCEEQQTRSFQQVKTLIVKAHTTPLRYYDRNLLVTVQVDTSLRGAGSLPHTATQGKGPADRLCQQEPHGCGDKVCLHRKGTSSHRLCLPTFQHLSTRKELRSRERPQTTWDDCHEEPCECATTSSENAARITEIWCHHQVPTREGNATGRCP